MAKMPMNMKKYERSAADMKEDKAGMKKSPKAAPAKGKGKLPAFMMGKKGK